MSPQTAIEDRPAEAAQHWHPGLSKAEATGEQSAKDLVECPRCSELRAASRLSLKALADRAVVPRKAVFDLEHGLLARRTHARAVLRVLSDSGASVGDEAAELVSHRFLPNCRTLREKVWSKQNRLAALAGVEVDLVKGLEKGKSARLTEVMAVFQILRQHHRDRLRKDLDEGEIWLFPSDLPRPRLGPDGEGPTDTLSQDAVQSPTSPLPVALAPSDHEPKPEQSEPDIPPPEQMPEAAPVVPVARLDPGNGDRQPMPNPVPVSTPDAEEGTDEPDPTSRANVEREDEPQAAAEVAEAVAAKVLGPENEVDPQVGKDPDAEATDQGPAGPGHDNKEAQA